MAIYAAKKKGQLAIEFMTYIGIVLMIVVLASYSSVMAGKDVTNANEMADARSIASLIAQEINTAVEIGDGYYHTFYLPHLFRTSSNYTINVTSNSFVEIKWGISSYSLPLLSYNVTGEISKGDNTIKNNNGVITID